MDVDTFLASPVRFTPHLSEQLSFAHDLAGSRDEVDEQVELPRGELEFLPGQTCDPRSWVDLELTHHHRSDRTFCLSSTKHRPDASLEVLGRKGLYDVVVGPGVEQSHDLLLARSGGGDDHGNSADRSQHFEQFESVKVGETQVEDDCVWGC